ncbi:MAG: methyl-accepting chemotaxis protein [Aquincola tertiaricarbonis]
MYPSVAVLAPDVRHRLKAVARAGDLVMLLVMAASALAALAIGQSFGQLGLALGWTVPVCAVGLAVFFAARGSVLSQLVLVGANVVLVALHIQLGRGTLEFHFGVFVLLGMVLVYRDWRPAVLVAALFAVHHLVFDRLQAMGWAVYCTPQPDLLKTLMHAVYVVAQTAIEVLLALRLRRATIEAAELSALVRQLDRGHALCLDVTPLAVTAPTAVMLKAAVQKMHAAMGDVGRASLAIEQAAAEIATGNMDLSQRTEAQAGNLQQTASSMEQLTGAVRNTADTAAQADVLAREASAAAVQGGELVDKVVQTIGQISDSSRRIADIIGTIDGIAFQTNILALNAAVEAARAGEQGRGFAVVAAEVRGLAKRSADAAKEIKVLIGNSVERVEAGTRLVGDAGSSMRNIVDQARRVSQLIGEISGAASQQTTGITQVGGAVTQLDAVTQQNAALVEQGAAAAESLRREAAQLHAVVGRFVLTS